METIDARQKTDRTFKRVTTFIHEGVHALRKNKGGEYKSYKAEVVNFLQQRSQARPRID